MTEVIPAILAQNEEEFTEKIQNIALRAHAKTWQIDVLDGSMFHAHSWADPNIIAILPSLPNLELHLMIQDPLKTVLNWHELTPFVTRVIIHAEIGEPLEEIVLALRELGVEVGIAINPETTLDCIENAYEYIDLLLIMGVHPGASGQRFLGEQIIQKIKEAKNSYPALTIAVDGGVKEHNAPAIVQAGADQLCIGSGLWDAEDLATVYDYYSSL